MGIGVTVIGTEGVLEDALASKDSVLISDMAEAEALIPETSELSGYILDIYHTNRDAKMTSGIENEIVACRLAYNGEYSYTDKAKIHAEGGSDIFMNITATKAKAARSWMMDILLPPQERSWILSPTPLPELPAQVTADIEKSIQDEFSGKSTETAPTSPVDPNAPPSPPISPAVKAQESLKDMNQKRRDIKDAVSEEINKEARFQLRKMEVQIDDQLKEGGWDKALSDFITDFVVYPTAFIKGPIVTKKNKITWVNGDKVVSEQYVYLNKRVDPLDIYPSPDATSIQDGSLIEHIRLSKSELTYLKGVEDYDSDRIDTVLEGATGNWFIDSAVETTKTDLEKRGTQAAYDESVIHGLHFFGPVPVEKLKSWGMTVPPKNTDSDGVVEEFGDNDVVECEILLAGGEVIKAQINDDPLQRRPYYKASFMDLPGSFWGRSLPNMMRDIQRMCNAVARALANNLGMSSGLQVTINIDRLADNGDIEEIIPRKIWQVKNDPSGNTAKPVEFFQPTSNANELLAVFDRFETRADDVTGIPKYAYGNDPNTAAGRPTLGGLSLMLESATKIIKDAVRNIDLGVIQPRIEYQFYWNLITDDSNKYTGDVNVVPRGSSALTIKAAQQIRRNELLQVTANPYDQTLIGPVARAEILREIGKDLGMDSNVIPSALEVKANVQKAQDQQAALQKQPPPDNSLQIVQMQTQAMAQVTQMQGEMKRMQMEFTAHMEQAKLELRQMEINSKNQIEQMKLQAKIQTAQATNQVIVDNKNKDVAVKLRSENAQV